MKRQIFLAVRVDLSLIRAGNLFEGACFDESHRSMNVLVVNRETLRLPAVEPEDPPDRATLRKTIQKSFNFLIFRQPLQFCSALHEVLANRLLLEL